MKCDIRMPQGKYKVGRDIAEGIYLIAALNDYSEIKIQKEDPKRLCEYYNLNGENSKMCHVEIENGDVMYIYGNVKIRRVTRLISDGSADLSLLEEIEDFRNSTFGSKTVNKSTKVVANKPEEKYEIEEERTDDAEDAFSELGRAAQGVADSINSFADDIERLPKKKKPGFWGTLAALLGSSSSSSHSSSGNSGFSTKKKHSGRCDGDCDNCPPHYGYRYGRWYYGHSHSEGCVFGGNKCSGGID